MHNLEHLGERQSSGRARIVTKFKSRVHVYRIMEDLRPQGREYIPFTIGLGYYMNRALEFARKPNMDPQLRKRILTNAESFVSPTSPYYWYQIGTGGALVASAVIGLAALLNN